MVTLNQDGCSHKQNSAYGLPMKLLKCIHNYPPYQKFPGTKFCSAAMPCGRCLHDGGICGDVEMVEFYCDNCKYRFLCFTNCFEYNEEIFEMFGEPHGHYEDWHDITKS